MRRFWNSLRLLYYLFLIPLLGAEEANSEQEQAQKIEAQIKARLREWSSLPTDSRPSFSEKTDEIVQSLQKEEVRLVALHLFDSDICGAAYRIWAQSEPRTALKAIRQLEDLNRAEVKLAGTGLEGGPGEALSGYLFSLYLAAIEGWSQVDPPAAWTYFKNREDAFANSLVIEDYGSNFYEVIFENLAKALR